MMHQLSVSSLVGPLQCLGLVMAEQYIQFLTKKKILTLWAKHEYLNIPIQYFVLGDRVLTRPVGVYIKTCFNTILHPAFLTAKKCGKKDLICSKLGGNFVPPINSDMHVKLYTILELLAGGSSQVLSLIVTFICLRILLHMLTQTCQSQFAPPNANTKTLH
jgi:hypothetical protein